MVGTFNNGFNVNPQVPSLGQPSSLGNLAISPVTNPVGGAAAQVPLAAQQSDDSTRMLGMVAQMLFMVTQLLCDPSMKGALGASAPAAAASPPAAAPASNAASTTAQQPAQQANNGRLRIAVIDDFSTDRTGFNHGESVEQEITRGGNVDTVRFDRARQGQAGIAGSLEEIVQRVRNGEQIDAVNLSQAHFQATGDTQRVQSAVAELKNLGVPVAIAAGNNGPNQVNQLTSNNSFNVSNGTAQSGQGNITAQGRTTSFATANLVTQLAQLKSQGLSVDQIRAQLGVG
jgi:hypothetical protein